MNKQNFELGTAVKITTILSINNPSSCKITIKDASNIAKTTATSMTADAPNIYSFVYQSSVDDVIGEYLIIIDAIYGVYNSRAISYMTFIDSEP
jgi:hypothetical protein